MQHGTALAAGTDSDGGALAAAKKSLVAGSRLAYTDALSLEHELFTELAATSSALKAAGHT